MDRNGQHSHVNMQTQLKSEYSKHNMDGNSIFHSTKLILRNISTRASRGKKRPRARESHYLLHIVLKGVHIRRRTLLIDCRKMPLHIRRRTLLVDCRKIAIFDVNSHNKSDSITRNDIQSNKDLHNERQSAASTPKDRYFQEKVNVRQ